MRSASGPPARAISSRMRPKPAWVEAAPLISMRGNEFDRNARPFQPAPAFLGERHALQERFDVQRRQLQAGEPVPLLALVDALARPQLVELGLGHQPGVVVLVALERQPQTLDGVGDEAHGRPGGHSLEGLDDGLHVVAAEVRHQTGQRRIVVARHNGERVGMAGKIRLQLAPPRRPALEHQGRVEHVRALVDPAPQALAAGLAEGVLQELAVLEENDLPAQVLEQPGQLHEQAVGDDRVEALAVVVDHPPAVVEPVLPILQQRLVDVALVELGIAHQRHHAPLRPIAAPALGVHVVLHQACETRHRHAKTHRAGGEVYVVGILGARRVRLGTAEAAEILQVVERLVAQEILDRVEHRAGVRLHRHPVLRPQDVEVERRHQRHQRGGGGLVTAHLEPVATIHLVVGVVDHVGGEPQHLALQLAQHVQRRGAWRSGRCTFHQCTPPALLRTSTASPAALSLPTVSSRWARSRVSITTSSSAPLAGRSVNTRW